MSKKLDLDNLPGVVMAYLNVDDTSHRFRNGREQVIELGKKEAYLEFDSGHETFTTVDALTYLSSNLKTGSVEEVLRKRRYGDATDITRYIIEKTKDGQGYVMTPFRLMRVLYILYAYHLGTYGKEPFAASFRVNHSGIAEMEMYFLYAGYGLFSKIPRTYPEAEVVMNLYYDVSIIRSIDRVLKTLEEYDDDQLIEICKGACFYDEYMEECVNVPDPEILKDWERLKKIFTQR